MRAVSAKYEAAKNVSPTTRKLLFGYIAGLCAETAIYPLDTVRRRQQALGDASPLGRLGQFDVLPLHLLDFNDIEYMTMLFELLHKRAEAVQYYLEYIVFPDTTAHQAMKLSANRQASRPSGGAGEEARPERGALRVGRRCACSERVVGRQH